LNQSFILLGNNSRAVADSICYAVDALQQNRNMPQRDRSMLASFTTFNSHQIKVQLLD